MKHLTFLLTDTKAYTKASKKAKKKKYISILIQVYFGQIKKKSIQKKLSKIKKDFPRAVIIGATTAGEISHAKMYEKETLLSVSLFKSSKLNVTYVEEVNAKSAVVVAQNIYTKDAKAAIVLSEGLLGEDYEAFLENLHRNSPNMIIAGGLAGDNFELKQSYVTLDENIYDKGVVALSFVSKKLFASNEYNLNWRPIGKTFQISEVSANIVKKIEGIPALDFFQKYLGKKILHENDLALPNFQLLFKEGSTLVARTPMAIDGTDIIFAGPVAKGQLVQFGFSNESLVLTAADDLREDIAKRPAEAIYIFSCVARKALLGKTLQEEFSSFEDIAPTAGFFTYGEFYSSKTASPLLNCTTTILILSESRKKAKVKEHYHKQKRLDTITFDALSHFIKQTSLELEKNVRLMNQYKDIVDASFLVSKTDINGNITYVNDNFCKVSQYTKEQLLGKNHNIVRDPKVSAFIFKKMWQTITAKKVWKGKFSNRAKDGSLYYVDASIMPILDESGEIQEYIAIRQDITRQIQAKSRMQEKEKLIRAIFDNQENIVIHASKVEGMQRVNKKFFEYFSFENFEDFKAHHSCICDLFLEQDGYVYPTKYPDWLEMIASDEAKDYKVKMLSRTKKEHTFIIKVKRIENEYIINLNDVTTLEEALLKAYSSEQAKSIFLANMSHEIRTPLNGILGFTDLLSKKELESDAKRYVNIIHKSGETLLNVVNDILDFSKIESGELTLHETPSDLFEAMEVAVSTFASVSKKKKINYYVFIDTNIPKSVVCDVQRLKQVMSNLISNALKFTPEDGEVFVRVEVLKKGVDRVEIHFSVKDSGIGIAKEKIGTVFEAFSQADNSISREFGGTGLGLAISNEYIKMMGSSIKLESEFGKGSEFSFRLEFDVVDATHSVKNFDINSANIAILNSYEGISCGINQIVYQYLDAWQCEYNELNRVDEIDRDTDILIVCAKLLELEQCKELLEKYPTLKLIYIEGSQGSMRCDHDRFYLIEQPMTGSSLFDRLISLLDRPFFEDKSDIPLQSLEKFEGIVLIAEDNETNQMLISILLDERDVAYKIVENGEEVLDEISHNPEKYDLILMDINMPLLDGIGATKALRERGYIKPIVSLSANVIEADTKAFKEAGMNDILKKPIVPTELETILAKYLEIKEDEEAFDLVDVRQIAESLFIQDETIIINLLKSLEKSFESMLQELESDRCNAELLHKLKGVSGNMRFEKLYSLVCEVEDKFDLLADREKNHYLQRLKKHLQEALKKIKTL